MSANSTVDPPDMTCNGSDSCLHTNVIHIRNSRKTQDQQIIHRDVLTTQAFPASNLDVFKFFPNSNAVLLKTEASSPSPALSPDEILFLSTAGNHSCMGPAALSGQARKKDFISLYFPSLPLSPSKAYAHQELKQRSQLITSLTFLWIMVFLT